MAGLTDNNNVITGQAHKIGGMMRNAIHFSPKQTALIPNNQRGFTILELLIGLLAASILSYAALSLYITQHKQMLVQDEIADMQDNLRASAEVLASTIRLAGLNAPKSTAIEGHNSNPDTIAVNFDSSVLRNVKVSENIADASSDIYCVGSDLSGIIPDEYYYIFDPFTDTGEFFIVTGIMNSDRIQHDTTPLSRLYPAGSRILKMNRIRFFVDRSDTSHTNLMMQTFGSEPQIFAENVANLNFRYFLNNGAIVDQTNTPDKIRLVEIDLEGRTASRDRALFNQYRTRNFTLRVNVRNLGLSLP